ncbi:MAG: hypothetical protein WDO69_31760 [Pseudomonadota bacterium]
MTFRRAFFAAFSTALLLGLAWGCSAADNSDGPNHSGGGSTGLTDAGNDRDLIMPSGTAQDSGQLLLNPLCGDALTIHCVPDSPISCIMYSEPVVPGEDAAPSAEAEPADAADAADATASGQAGTSGEGGSSGADSAGLPNSSGAAGDGGASGAAGEAGAGGAAGASGAPAVTPPKYNCQVQRMDSAPLKPTSHCALAGPGGENAPCLTASDCRAGLGCVGDQNAGLCQKYCCQDADDCEPGTYCAERPMRDSTVNALPQGASTAGKQLLIPVCVHAENCDLSAPYPCPKGSECACQSGTACLVVRSDGTTTCAVPGAGKVGDACPCAWGHVCSAATSKCLELCYTRGSGTCGDGECQAASELPDGWGVCVGVTPIPG